MFESVLIETLLPAMITIIGYFLAKFDRDMEEHFKVLDTEIRQLKKVCAHLNESKINMKQLKSVEKELSNSLQKRLDIYNAMVQEAKNEFDRHS